MMKKGISILLAALLLLAPLSALGALRMPDRRGSVTDDADVLSAQTAADLAAYIERAADETGLELHVAIVHFLDGAEVQAYANTLFDLWELGSDDMLLLGAAGEDSFASVMGSDVQKALGATNAENLMYTSSEFGALFRAQQYDAAFAVYCSAFSALAEKQLGETIRMDGLFGQTAPSPAQQAQAFGSELWSDIMASISDSSAHYQDDYERREREENGLTAGGWIVLIILVMIMLRKNKYERRRRRERSGCLGWIFGLFGINILIDLLRGRRD